MPIATRTFRVFVSSTFEDLKAERDALQREVFPRLRQLCEQHGARFQAIDLRWGVRDEAALDQKTMEICLREIERCQKTGIKPNFIVLLGQRYGWRPLPSRIEAREFEAVRDRVSAPVDRALVENWYRRDDNAVPVEHVLRPRSGEWVDPKRWCEPEARLHQILLDAARAAGLPEQALVKYEASATHQEILNGIGATPENRKHVFVFCRDVPDKDSDPDLISLKRLLRAQLPEGNVRSYKRNDLKGVCQDVERTLRAMIESEAAGFESRPALALEIEAHDVFARERALVFGRESVLKAITGYIGAGGDRTLMLHGMSGSGKSAVMAKASEQALAVLPSAVVIRRFIGTSPESSSGLTLLRRLAEQVGEAYDSRGELPVDFNGAARVFRERLALATSAQPLVIFIDALDQLGTDDPARSSDWLGHALPPHCRIVVSTTEVAPSLKECRPLELDVLPQTDAAAALDHWLGAARRQLQPAQSELLLAAFARCGLPLYLKLAFEEARGWASYDSADDCPLGEGVEGVIDSLLNRLSLKTNHGPLFVSRGLGYLAAARYGLTEDEMLDVLSADDGVWEDFERRAHHTPPERRLPVIVWSRLFLDLEPYLAERAVPGGKATSFYHRQLAEQVTTKFLAGDERQTRHVSLAEYFGAKPHWIDAARNHPNARKAAELVHHHLGAGRTEEASAILTDLQFVAAKCAADLVFDLQDDYAATMALLPEAQPALEEERRRQERMERWTCELVEYSRAWSDRRDRIADSLMAKDSEPVLPDVPDSVERWSEERIVTECERIRRAPGRLDSLKAFARFAELENHSLSAFGGRPGFVVQHAYNHAPSGPVHAPAEAEVRALSAHILLRQWPPRAVYNPTPALVRTLEGHRGAVQCVNVTPDGRRAVSGSKDGTLRVWDLGTGACLRTLDQSALVDSVRLTPDGTRVVSASFGSSVRVWDLTTGLCLRELEGSTGFQRVSITANGRRAISGANADSALRVWDLDSGECLRTLVGHSGHVISDGLSAEVQKILSRWGINSLSMTPDGRWAVLAGTDQNLQVWDLETGAYLHTLKGHRGAILSVDVTPDGRWAVSTGWDATLWVWDLRSGACVRILEGHRGWVMDVSVTADGRRAVSAGMDDTLRVWDLETGACLQVLEGHNLLYSVSVTADGRRAVSASGDGMLGVWNLETSASQRITERHSQTVNCVSATSDGRRAVSGSRDRTARLWDLESGECLCVFEGHGGSVDCAGVTPDGRWAVSGSQDYTARVWDLESGACLHVLKGHSGSVDCVGVTPDGRMAVSASFDKTLRVWDLKTGACLHVLEGHSGYIKGLSLTPDSRRAVSASWDQTLRVWDLEKGVCLRTLEGHKSGVLSVSVTPDGRHMVSGSDDQTVRLWDLETGECLQVLEGHDSTVMSVNVTPDGRRVVAGTRERWRLWDLDTGEWLRDMERLNWENSRAISSVLLVPDGRQAVSASYDNTLRVWDLESGCCLALTRGDASWNALAVVASDSLIAGSATGEVAAFRMIEPDARPRNGR